MDSKWLLPEKNWTPWLQGKMKRLHWESMIPPKSVYTTLTSSSLFTILPCSLNKNRFTLSSSQSLRRLEKQWFQWPLPYLVPQMSPKPLLLRLKHANMEKKHKMTHPDTNLFSKSSPSSHSPQKKKKNLLFRCPNPSW